jgi:hypothetical protein
MSSEHASQPLPAHDPKVLLCSLAYQEWTGRLKEASQRWGWPVCLCMEFCTCNEPLFPVGLAQLLKTYAPFPLLGFRSLAFTGLPLDCPWFIRGLKEAVKTLIDATQQTYVAEVMEHFLNGEKGPRLDQPLRTWERDEKYAKRIKADSASHLHSQSLGYLCGWILHEQTQLWNRLYKDAGYVDKEIFRRELADTFEDATNSMKTLSGLVGWFSSNEMEKLYPMSSAVLRACVYWLVQSVLFELYDLALINKEGWPVAYQHYRSGVLPWQTGWTRCGNEVLGVVNRIFSYEGVLVSP